MVPWSLSRWALPSIEHGRTTLHNLWSKNSKVHKGRRICPLSIIISNTIHHHPLGREVLWENPPKNRAWNILHVLVDNGHCQPHHAATQESDIDVANWPLGNRTGYQCRCQWHPRSQPRSLTCLQHTSKRRCGYPVESVQSERNVFTLSIKGARNTHLRSYTLVT